MTAVPGNLAIVALGDPESNPINPSGYVSSRLLAANTAETITVPANAAFVRLAANADFYIAYGGVAAVVPVDIDDGTSNELIKQNSDAVWRSIKGQGTLSVISAGVCIVTASFYTN